MKLIFFKLNRYNLIAILFALILPISTYAQTPTAEWVNFYSSNSIYAANLITVGTIVEAYDPEGVLCGKDFVTEEGKYGFLACYIDDLNTSMDEGIRPGDTVTFRISGQIVGQFTVPATVQNGDRFELDLNSANFANANDPNAEPLNIPEPFTVVLFGSGLAGLTGYVHRRKQKVK